MVVLGRPAHLSTWQPSPVQAPPSLGQPGHALATPPDPQAAPLGHVMGQSSTPAQPSPMRPQYWPPPGGVQLIGTQLATVQMLERTLPHT